MFAHSYIGIHTHLCMNQCLQQTCAKLKALCPMCFWGPNSGAPLCPAASTAVPPRFTKALPNPWDNPWRMLMGLVVVGFAM